jgi:hypothetical protein
VEARATVNGASVSKTFVAAILVLVAIGLGAMGGYVAKGLGASGTTAAQSQQVHPAPGTVLRQDNPPKAAGDNSAVRGNKGGARGTHGEI